MMAPSAPAGMLRKYLFTISPFTCVRNRTTHSKLDLRGETHLIHVKRRHAPTLRRAYNSGQANTQRLRSPVSLTQTSLISAFRAVVFAGFVVASAAQAGPDWPAHAVRIIATSPPGGSVDFLARALATDFGEAFGRPFVVENHPGANGNIGVELVLRAPADGHAMFVSPPGPFSINSHLMPEMPFDPVRDVAPVAMLAVTPLLLVVHPSVPAR